MKIYISGKITGDRRYKAKFREVEKKLAAAGHIVLNPATAPEGLRPVDYMRLCFAMMEAADGETTAYLPGIQKTGFSRHEQARLS